jgi:hypothetical protein
VRAASALAILALVPFLAGCTDGAAPDPPLDGIAPGELRAGGAYSFHHAGGTLVFTLGGEGDASFDLFDGADQRLGSVGFSSSPAGASRHTIDGVDAGELVLLLTTINGTLRVESAGQAVAAFRPLGTLVERHLLADEEPRANPLFGLNIPTPGSRPYDETFEVSLVRAPTALRVLATGPNSGLAVEVRSSKGIVLTADGDTAGPSAAIGDPVSLYAIPGTLTPQNIRDGELVVRVTADDLAGAVVLEAQSFSRVRLPTPQRQGPDPSDVSFTYGSLPGGPVGFTVHRDARTLVLWQEGTPEANATVALFGPHDERIATVLVPAVGTAEVAVSGGGDFVAVLLEGKATLGADVAPSDFDLHPLGVAKAVVPVAVAGSYSSQGGRYGQAMEEAEAPTAFALRANRTASSGSNELGSEQPLPLCGSGDRGRYLRVDQGGEAILAYVEPQSASGNVDPEPAFRSATRALGAGPLQVWSDGFGADGCDRPVIDVLSYVRP